MDYWTGVSILLLYETIEPTKPSDILRCEKLEVFFLSSLISFTSNGIPTCSCNTTYLLHAKTVFFFCEKNNSPEGIPCINCLLQSSQESAVSGGTIRARILPPAPNQIDTLEHGCKRTPWCRPRPMQNPACTECFLLFNFITSFFTASLETNRCGNASRALNTLA